MPTKLNRFDKKAIRDWTLYVIEFTNGHYYIGITSYKDFMLRINQHGGRSGAKVNREKIVKEIVEVQHLGKISSLEAQNIENDTMLDYRKRFGAHKVRGGYDIYQKTSIIPTYTPGSLQSIIFIFCCLAMVLLLLIIIA
jgi:predicted GIY-YIG superfamily endonuclease